MVFLLYIVGKLGICGSEKLKNLNSLRTKTTEKCVLKCL